MAYYVAGKSFDMGRDPKTGKDRNYKPGDYVPEAMEDGRDPKPWIARGYLVYVEGIPPSGKKTATASVEASTTDVAVTPSADAPAKKKATRKKRSA